MQSYLVMAATKRNNSRWGCMQLTLKGVTGATKKLLLEALQDRLEKTLGPNPSADGAAAQFQRS